MNPHLLLLSPGSSVRSRSLHNRIITNLFLCTSLVVCFYSSLLGCFNGNEMHKLLLGVLLLVFPDCVYARVCVCVYL